MPETHHPCGALPVVGLNVSAWWCEHHQAAHGMAYVYRQDEASGDEPRVLWSVDAELGPFDSREDLRTLVADGWLAWLNHTA